MTMENKKFMSALEKSFETDCGIVCSSEIPEYECSKGFEDKMSRLIKSRRKSYFNLICTTGRRVACVAVLLLIVSVSSLSVDAVRESLGGFFFDNSGLNVSDDGGHRTIEKIYSPTYIPSGYELTLYSPQWNHHQEWYYSKNDGMLIFSQFLKHRYHDVEIGNGSVTEEYTDTDGQEYLIFTYEDYSIILWDNGEYVLYLQSRLDKETSLEVCRSIELKGELEN